MRKQWALGMMLAVVFVFAAGLSVGRATDRDEVTLTVPVSSADHEIQEGYFTLGAEATLVAKPGSDLHKFLSRQRDRKVKLTLSDVAGPELSRLER